MDADPSQVHVGHWPLLQELVRLVVAPVAVLCLLSILMLWGWSELIRERGWPFRGGFDPTGQKSATPRISTPSGNGNNAQVAPQVQADGRGEETFDYSQFGDGFAPLNSIFSGIAAVLVSLSVYLQVKSLRGTDSSLKLQAAATRAQIRTSRHEALMNANQQFHSPQFERSRTRARVVLQACIMDRKFCRDFLCGYVPVRGTYVSMFSRDPKFQKRLRRSADVNSVMDEVLFDPGDGWRPRHVVTEVLNFYVALKFVSLSDDILKVNSFYYEFWRPHLWFLVDHLEDPQGIFAKESPYTIGITDRSYSAALHQLDRCFGLPELTHADKRAEFFFRHPWIQRYAVDRSMKYPQTKIKPKFLSI